MEAKALAERRSPAPYDEAALIGRVAHGAAIVGCPVDTVKTRMFHARRRLRALLANRREEAA